jgi:hypothetical protein
MEIGFTWRESSGTVTVDCFANDDVEALGCPPWSEGYPVCTATVAYPARGYDALFGWVQLVKSTDNESGGTDFEMDPILLFFDAPSPYAWYGTNPTLFDAPGRPQRVDMSWEAHSFLATTPFDAIYEGRGRIVVPLAGFSWGFDTAGETVTLREVARLSRADWERHLPVLRRAYTAWKFEDDGPVF